MICHSMLILDLINNVNVLPLWTCFVVTFSTAYSGNFASSILYRLLAYGDYLYPYSIEIYTCKNIFMSELKDCNNMHSYMQLTSTLH